MSFNGGLSEHAGPFQVMPPDPDSNMTATTSRPLLRILELGFGLAIGFGSTIGTGISRLPGMVAASLSDRTSRLFSWLCAGVAATILAACGQSTPGQSTASQDKAPTRESIDAPLVNFATFVGEIAPETLPSFTSETGIAVNYDAYELNQMLETRLLAGETGFDVVVPSNNFLEGEIAAGVYQKLDKTKLPNLKHLDPAILKQLELNDRGNQYAVPYLWGTEGLGYDVAKVESALGGPAPDSWALLFDPRNAAKLASCGINVPDVPWIMISLALLYLGRDPSSERREDLAAAMATLQAIRPHVREITSSTVTQQMIDGQACIAIAANNEFRAARQLSRDTGGKIDIRYVIPREGSILWMDVLAIPVDAPHPTNAHRLINYLLKPEVIAKVTESTGFANANLSSAPLVAGELRNDPMVYPDAASMQRLHIIKAHSDEYSRLQNREFHAFPHRTVRTRRPARIPLSTCSYRRTSPQWKQPSRRLDDHLPDLLEFVRTAARQIETGELQDGDALHLRIRDFYTADRMQAIETVAPGWQEMAAYADRATLNHITQVLIALQLLPEYRQASRHCRP